MFPTAGQDQGQGPQPMALPMGARARCHGNRSLAAAILCGAFLLAAWVAMADEGAPSTGRPLLRQDAPAASVQAKAAIAEVEVTENGGVWLQAGVVGPPAPSEPQSLTEDDVEVLLFAASGDTDPQASGVAADKAATPVSPVVERFVVAFENYRNHLSGASRFYPWAGVMEFFVANRILCPALHFLLLVLTSNPPSIGIVTAEKQPLNPDGTLPRPLKDLRGYEDMFVDEATLQAERNTYYYFYKMYDNLYAYALANKPSKTMLDPVAAGWYNQRVHFRNATHFGGTLRTSPFYVTVEKDGHVAVLLRGTMFRDEWEKDFMSRLTQPGETEPYFGGRVHAGTFRLFQEMVPHLMADLEARKPKHITLAGHSLGGGLSLMMGAYLGKLWDGERAYRGRPYLWGVFPRRQGLLGLRQQAHERAERQVPGGRVDGAGRRQDVHHGGHGGAGAGGATAKLPPREWRGVGGRGQ